jgi:hypothetical protein
MRTILVMLLAGTPLFGAEPPAPAPSLPVTMTLKDRHGHATPQRRGFTHTGAGNIDVQQPAPDTVVMTMTGVAVAGAHPLKDSSATMTFDLDQSLEIAITDAKVKRAKVTLEARVIGLLRSHKGGGTASEGPGHAGLSVGGAEIVGLDVPSHCVKGGDNLSINDRAGPVSGVATAGEYHLCQTFIVSAAHPSSLKPCKAASAEFAPDPALDPLWISYWEPFHGAAKKDFGFQVTIKAASE